MNLAPIIGAPCFKRAFHDLIGVTDEFASASERVELLVVVWFNVELSRIVSVEVLEVVNLVFKPEIVLQSCNRVL